MIYIENVDANTFKMHGENTDIPAETYPKDYEARSTRLSLDDEPLITVAHTQLGTRIVVLKSFDEIKIDSAAFETAQEAVVAFNTMMKTTPA